MMLSLVALPIGPGEAAPPNEPMTFEWRTIERSSVIVAEGVVTPETPEAFGNFARARAPALGTVVLLSSDGGDLEGGLLLGRAIRSLTLNTLIGEAGGAGIDRREVSAGRCASACALAFLGGVERALVDGSSFGVHQLRMDCVERWRTSGKYPWLPLPGTQYCPDFDEAMSAFQSAQGRVAAYVNEMGVDPLLFSEMSDVDASGLRFLTELELEAYRVTWAPETQPATE